MKKLIAKLASGNDSLTPGEKEIDPTFWELLGPSFAPVNVKPYFSSLEPHEIQELVRRAVANSPDYEPPDFFGYVEIDLPDEADEREFLGRLNSSQSIETAYFAPKGLNPAVDPADDPESLTQGYLDAAPVGIDARYAWTVPGGDGRGQRAIDLERGWTLEHEDLTAHGIKKLRGELEDASRWHGTCVLGVLCAVDNDRGCVGIAPNIADINVVSYINPGGEEKIADAVMFAANHLKKGDFLILEVQDDSEHPIEIWNGEYRAIELAVAAGIIVIEAAGNKGDNLDKLKDAAGRRVFNRNHADFRDSGAIMVAAAKSSTPHKKIKDSNYGSRIDCFGWGENITTCYSTSAADTNRYTPGFNNTSGATPIIAGAAVCLQGIAEARSGKRLSPREMRAILSDGAVNTKSAAPNKDLIGVMPDLKSIVEKYFG